MLTMGLPKTLKRNSYIQLAIIIILKSKVNVLQVADSIAYHNYLRDQRPQLLIFLAKDATIRKLHHGTVS